LTITELNPDHGGEDGSTIDRFVEGLVGCLARVPASAQHARLPNVSTTTVRILRPLVTGAPIYRLSPAAA